MTDLIERLREEPYPYEKRHGLGITAMEVWHKTACEAADEIERLKAQIALEQEYSEDLCKKGGEQEAEIERLQAALERIYEYYNEGGTQVITCSRIAREALRDE